MSEGVNLDEAEGGELWEEEDVLLENSPLARYLKVVADENSFEVERLNEEKWDHVMVEESKDQTQACRSTVARPLFSRIKREAFEYWRHRYHSVLCTLSSVATPTNHQECTVSEPFILDKQNHWGLLVVVALGTAVALLTFFISELWALVMLLLVILLSGVPARVFMWLLHYQHAQNMRLLHELVVEYTAYQRSLQQCLQCIQEMELISHGYRLSSPSSPITRLECNSGQRKLMDLRQGVNSSLARMMCYLGRAAEPLKYSDDVEDLSLLHLKSMRHCFLKQFISHFYPEVWLKQFCEAPFKKGREIHSLKANLMVETTNITTIWKNKLLSRVTMENTQDKISTKVLGIKVAPKCSQKFLKTLKRLKYQLQGIQVKLELCEQDLTVLLENIEQGNNEDNKIQQTLDNHLENFQATKAELDYALFLWQQSHAHLQRALIPIMDFSSMYPIHNAAEHSVQNFHSILQTLDKKEKTTQTLNIPISEQVFVAYTSTKNENKPLIQKKSRQERIKERKLKEEKKLSTHLEIQSQLAIVSELKSVLKKRSNQNNKEITKE